MAEFAVLEDFRSGRVRHSEGAIIDDTREDLPELERAGLAVAPVVGDVRDVITAYLSQRGNGRRDVVPFGDLTPLVLRSTGGASFVRTLSGLSVEAAIAAAGPLVAVTAADTTPGFLDDKLLAGAGLTRTILNPAADEDYRMDVIANADGSIVVNANDVQVGVLATDAQHGVRGGGVLLHPDATAVLSGFMSAADKIAFDAHLIDVSNPHVVTQQQAYVASAGTPQIALTDALGTMTTDSAARAGTEIDIIDNVDGATIVLRVSYDRTAMRTVVKTGTIGGFDFESTLFPDRSIISIGFDQLLFLRQDRSIVTGSPGFFLWNSTLTLPASIPFLSRSFGGFIDLGGTFQFDASTSPFGMGNALLHRATWKNTTTVVANLGPSFLFANNAIYQADGATITSSQARIFFDNTTYNVINAGVGSQAVGIGHNSLYSNMTIGAGWTIGLRRAVYMQDATVAGTLTTQTVVHVDDLNAAGENNGIRSLILSGAGKFFIQHTGTARADFGGIIGLGTGATVDWEISRIAPNLAALATGDSLAINTGNLLFGAASTVGLSSSVANRLDLASGDTLRLVTGPLEFAGAAEQISRTAGELLLTAAQVRTSAELEIDGTLDHDGALAGFRGSAPVAISAAYAPTNVTPDRAYDADATTLDEIADVLGTVIADLQVQGLLG